MIEIRYKDCLDGLRSLHQVYGGRNQ